MYALVYIIFQTLLFLEHINDHYKTNMITEENVQQIIDLGNLLDANMNSDPGILREKYHLFL